MKVRTVYKILLFSTLLAGVAGAGIGCYYLLKSKEAVKESAIERSALSYQIRPAYQFKTALAQKDEMLALDLLAQGEIDPNHPYCKEHGHLDTKGEDPLLIEVVKFGSPALLQAFLQYDVDLYVTSCENRTAVEEAIYQNNPDMLALLLQRGQIDITRPYHQTGKTLFQLAVMYRAEDVIVFLQNRL